VVTAAGVDCVVWVAAVDWFELVDCAVEAVEAVEALALLALADAVGVAAWVLVATVVVPAWAASAGSWPAASCV
jgi:hypothetical protein